MARRMPEESWQNGDILTPEEVMGEAGAIASEINGHLDRDNMAASVVTGAKCAPDTVHRAVQVSAAAMHTVALKSNRTEWLVVDDLTWTGVLAGGVFEIIGHACVRYDTAGGNPNTWSIGIRVDGDLVAESYYERTFEVDMNTLYVVAHPRLGPGEHTVEVVWRLNTESSGNAITIDFFDRRMLVWDGVR